MLSAAEIARGVQGAVAFLWRDPRATSYFDNTTEACLRSFRVMVLVAPLQVILLLIRYSGVTTAADEMEIFVVETISYVVEWLLFPVIFHEIARRQGWLDRYARYIGALNWINLPGMLWPLCSCRSPSLRPPRSAIWFTSSFRRFSSTGFSSPRDRCWVPAGRSRSCC